jgi:hypothetical protein
LVPHYRRRKPDKKFIPAGEQIQNGRTIREQVGKARHVGEKLTRGSRTVGFPGQNVVRTVEADQRSM